MIGSNIQSGRKTMSLTQEQLAERLGVARQTVAKWEAGDSVPDLANAGALAEALDVSLDALVGFDPQGTMLPMPPRGKHLFGTVTVGERAANPDAHLTLAWVPHDRVRGLYFYDDFDVRFAETFHDGSWFAGVDQADLLSRIACPALYLKAKTKYGEGGLFAGSQFRRGRCARARAHRRLRDDRRRVGPRHPLRSSRGVCGGHGQSGRK